MEEAVELAGRIISRYPKGKDVTSKSYIGALATVLTSYPQVVVQKAADPIEGVVAEVPYLPTVAHLVAWCERKKALIQDPVDTGERLAKLHEEARERERADQFWRKARAERPTLEELRAKHGQDWGLHVREPKREWPSIPWDRVKITPSLRLVLGGQAIKRRIDDLGDLDIEI